MNRKRRTLKEFLADMDHWAGYINDPAETDGPCLWLDLNFKYFGLTMYLCRARGK